MGLHVYAVIGDASQDVTGALH